MNKNYKKFLLHNKQPVHLIPMFVAWGLFCFVFSSATVMVQKFNEPEPSAEIQFCSANQQGKIAPSSSEELFLKRVRSDIFSF